jgi:branched-chain amino acid aminotransferase
MVDIVNYRSYGDLMSSPGTAGPLFRIERAPRSRLVGVDLSNVPFSSVFSDHMLVAEFRDGAWLEGEIRPYGPFPLTPSASVIQYGLSVFEGLKAQRRPDGAVTLFRPGENGARLNRSARRLAMPDVPEALFLDGIRALLQVDEGWVPPHRAGALYIRASLFSTDPSVRVKPADQFAFIIFTFPFSAYYSAPLDVLVTSGYVRAFPGGTGDVKPSGNYAPTMLVDREARAAGFDAVLWLDGLERRYLEECGVMNVFAVIEQDGAPRVVTPPLGGTILPGITRDSAIALLRDMGFAVDERRMAIEELVEHHRAGRLRECFGTGTAVTLSHIKRIQYGREDLLLPPIEARTVGPALRERLLAIAAGVAPDPHGWIETV